MGLGEEPGRKKAIVILSVMVPIFGITYSLVAIIRNNFAATGFSSVAPKKQQFVALRAS